ncbi:MAG: hypothetical protein Q8L36_01035 [bacterium]|nr:hypothetical protein [bacterium]
MNWTWNAPESASSRHQESIGILINCHLLAILIVSESDPINEITDPRREVDFVENDFPEKDDTRKPIPMIAKERKTAPLPESNAVVFPFLQES